MHDDHDAGLSHDLSRLITRRRALGDVDRGITLTLNVGV
jgi:hypothetical protein